MAAAIPMVRIHIFYFSVAAAIIYIVQTLSFNETTLNAGLLPTHNFALLTSNDGLDEVSSLHCNRVCYYLVD